ncbi:MAG: leucine--tRNA ligase [Candidatus Altiarchaeota archaeon]|nr:leucine--tRNA ligase [Candidatus Altiarchaeota archaeon]
MEWKSYEAKWQAKWKTAKLFVPNKKGKKFFLTVPYPYTSGAFHIGHGRTYTTGDVIARYKRHQGLNVLFPMAFHISGSPIISISDKIKAGDKKTIEMYKQYIHLYEKDKKKAEQILSSFTEPKAVADFFATKIIQDFQSLGYSIDWTRQFNTGEPSYNSFVEWQFMRLKDRDVIKKDKHPVIFSIKEAQPVGEDDIKDGDTDKVSIQEFTAIKFKFKQGFLVAATLRPETVFGATNLWLNPDADYVWTKVEKEEWLISVQAAEKLGYQKHEVKLAEKIKGSKLMGQSVKNIVGNERELPILPASFVDPDHATGVVYSVPAHAPYDWQGLADLRKDRKFGELAGSIEPIVIIDLVGWKVPAQEICENMGITNQNDSKLEEATAKLYKEEFYKGKLNSKCSKFAGIDINKIKDKVKLKLKKARHADIFFETSRKAQTRSGSKVIVAVLKDQWFIDYSPAWWKKQAHSWIDKMFIYPDKYRKLFHDSFDWLDKRPCARNKGLGTRFPFDTSWVIESLSDSTIYMAFYTIVGLIRQAKLKKEQLKPELFDFVFFGKGNLTAVSKTTGVAAELLKDMRAEFEYWYPNDLRHTAPAHVSNHLSFFVLHHIAIFPDTEWPRGISLNELLIREGVKMSKSKGNVIPLTDIANKYGADLYRLYVISSADLNTVVDWKEKDVLAARSKLARFVEIMEAAANAEARKPISQIDRWLVSRFYSALDKTTEHMDKTRFRDAMIDIFFKLLNDISWFEKRADKPAELIRTIAADWLIAMAPVIPHISEEYWNRLGQNGFVSVAPWPKIKKGAINKQAEFEEKFVQQFFDDMRRVIKMTAKKPKKILVYTALDWKYKALKLVANEKQAAMKKLDKFDNKKLAAKTLQSFIKQRVWELDRPRIDELGILRQLNNMVKHEFGAELVIDDNYDPLDKKSKAMPFRPAVYLE